MAYEWDPLKELRNRVKHRISFDEAILAFEDPQRRFFYDPKHSMKEQRFYCVGNVNGRAVTVRLTMRGNNIRIIGATYGDWTK